MLKFVMARVKFIIKGNVQKVNMRGDTRDKAVSSDLVGEVYNKLNHVEVIVDGQEQNINKFEEWLNSLKVDTEKRKKQMEEIKSELENIEGSITSFSNRINKLEEKLGIDEKQKIEDGSNEDLNKKIKLLKLELKNLKLKQISKRQEQIDKRKELQKLEIIRQEIWSVDSIKLTEKERKGRYSSFKIIENKADKEHDFRERIYRAADDLSAIRTSTIDYMNFDKIDLDFAHLDVKYSAFSDAMGEFIESQNNLIAEMKTERTESEKTIKTLVEDIQRLIEKVAFASK